LFAPLKSLPGFPIRAVQFSGSTSGRTTTQVRINANTLTPFRLRIPDSRYQEYNQDLSFATDNTITVTVPQIGQVPLPPTTSTLVPIPSTSTPGPTSQTSTPTTQQVRAYRNIFFGMTYFEFSSAIEADSEIIPTDVFLVYDVFVDGIPLKMIADFNDDAQLIRLLFESKSVSSNYYKEDVKDVSNRLTHFLTRAYGEPSATFNPPSDYYFIDDPLTVVTIWAQPEQDKTALIAIIDENFNYYVRFVVLQDSLYDAFQNKEAGDF
jgi:hypothetical protein